MYDVTDGSPDGHIEVWTGDVFVSDYLSPRGRTQNVASKSIAPEYGRKRRISGIWYKE